MMTKRYCSFLIALLMTLGIFIVILSAFPAEAHAADCGEIWVGGVRVTDNNKNSITSTNIKGKVYYNSAINVLTLENATIKGPDAFWKDPHISHQNAAIFVGGATDDLTIRLIGRNALISGNDGVSDMAAVYANCDLFITGDGYLTAYGTKKDEDIPRGRSCYGICVPSHTLSIDGADVSLYADETPYELSYGAYAKCILINYAEVFACAYSWMHDIYDKNKNLIGRDSTEDGIGLYGTIAINHSSVWATGGRYAIGRTPKFRNLVVNGPFVPCEYQDYKVFSCTPVKSYDICVGGTWITEENRNNVTGPQITGEVRFDPKKNLLLLRNAYLMGDNTYGINSGIYTTLPELTIQLVGKNGVVNGDYERSVITAIYAKDLRLEGKGSLTARGRLNGKTLEHTGIGVLCDIFEIDSGTIIAIGDVNAILCDSLHYFEAARAGVKMNGNDAHRFTLQEYNLSRQYRFNKGDTVKYFSLKVAGSPSSGVPNTGDSLPVALLCTVILLSGTVLLLRWRRRRSH